MHGNVLSFPLLAVQRCLQMSERPSPGLLITGADAICSRKSHDEAMVWPAMPRAHQWTGLMSRGQRKGSLVTKLVIIKIQTPVRKRGDLRNESKHLAFPVNQWDKHSKCLLNESNTSRSNKNYRFSRAVRRPSLYCQYQQTCGDWRFPSTRGNIEERGTRYSGKAAGVL